MKFILCFFIALSAPLFAQEEELPSLLESLEKFYGHVETSKEGEKEVYSDALSQVKEAAEGLLRELSEEKKEEQKRLLETQKP